MVKTSTPTIGCFTSNSFIIQITFSLDRFKFLSSFLDLIILNILRIIVKKILKILKLIFNEKLKLKKYFSPTKNGSTYAIIVAEYRTTYVF